MNILILIGGLAISLAGCRASPPMERGTGDPAVARATPAPDGEDPPALPPTAARPGDLEVIALRTGTAFEFKSLAIDAAQRRAYLGSWRDKAIVAVDLEGGGPARVIESRYNGKLNGMGVHLRGARLYAVMNETDDTPGATPLSVLIVIDVETERVIQSHELRATGGRHHFNHVVVDARGTAYISDTLKGRIYRVDTTDPHAKLELVIEHADLSWVHGIDLVDGESTLACTSYRGGIRFLSIADRAFLPYRDLATAGADGLEYHAGSLYGVGGNAITRYVLNATEDAIVRTEVVLRDHPLFNDPRALQVQGGWLYCLANLELEPVRFRRSGRMARDEPLTDSHLVKYRL